MRIGVYIEPWISQRAGISVFTEYLIRAAKNSKHTYVTIGSKQMDVPNEHIHIPKWKASHFNLLRFFGIGQIDLKNRDLDFIIDPGHFASLDLFKGSSRIVIVHDLTPLLFPRYHRMKSVVAHWVLMGRSLKKCEKIITVSDNTKKDVIEHYGYASKLHRIYPGIRDFSKGEIGRFDHRNDSPFMLAVGTIEPRKNHAKLLQAFDLFCEQNKSTRLCIVGDQGWKVNIEQLIEQSPNSDRISYLGYVSKAQLKELYSKALFSLYISLYEGFGFPLAEAMKVGCPVISSSVGSMKEIAGDAAFLVNPNAEFEISEAMLRLAEDADVREAFVASGRKQVERFEWTNYIHEMENILSQSE